MPTIPLKDKDWDMLMTRIKGGKCTPFVGAGACAGILPLSDEIAKTWARNYNFPLNASSDLAKVSQFLGVEFDPMFPKEQLLEEWLKEVTPPDFSNIKQPLRVLADLPLPLYMTTNYDDLLVQALKSRDKRPRRELSKWNIFTKDQPSVFDTKADYKPSVIEPVVFHLHGHDQVPESLVLTEDDYLDFLVNVSKDADLLPHEIRRAFAGTSLMFIGYSLEDWSFRVIFRGLVAASERTLRRISVAVQLPRTEKVAEVSEVQLTNGDVLHGKVLKEDPQSIVLDIAPMGELSIERKIIKHISDPRKIDPDQTGADPHKYMEKYFRNMDIRVFWGNADEFAAELRQRWEAASDAE